MCYAWGVREVTPGLLPGNTRTTPGYTWVTLGSYQGDTKVTSRLRAGHTRVVPGLHVAYITRWWHQIAPGLQQGCTTGTLGSRRVTPWLHPDHTGRHTGYTPGSNPGYSKVTPRLHEGTPRLHQGYTRHTPSSHPGHTQVTPG